MKRYWDHEESERAAMTMEQVQALLPYELMERGVLTVPPPALEPEPVVDLETAHVYVLLERNEYNSTTRLDVAFASLEDAEACRRAIKFIVENGWNEPEHVRPVREMTIGSVVIPTVSSVTAAKALVKEQERIRKANREAKEEHDKALATVEKETSDVWADWHRCREEEFRRERIRSTFKEYLGLTDGDRKVARAFLVKTFSVDAVEGALGPVQAEAVNG